MVQRAWHAPVLSSQMIKAICKNAQSLILQNARDRLGMLTDIKVLLLGRVEHLDGLFFAQRKETYIREICFSFH